MSDTESKHESVLPCYRSYKLQPTLRSRVVFNAFVVFNRFYSSVFSPLSGHKIPYLPVKGLAFKESLNRIGTRENGLLINSCELPYKWRHSRAYYCPPTLSA